MIVQTSAAIGALDVPRDGAVVDGPAIVVAGWVVIDGRPADVVEVSVNGETPARCRRCECRPDVNIAPTVPFGAGLAAGFAAVVPIPHRLIGHRVDVTVTARGERGSIWQCPPHAVDIERPKDPVERLALPPAGQWPHDRRPTPKPPAPLRAGAARVCAMTHSLNIGGGELYLQELLLRLRADHGLQLMVVAPSDGPLRPELESAGIPVHLTGVPGLQPLPYRSRVIELGSLLTAWDCDAAIVNTLGMFGFADAARWAGLPVLWAVHESFPLAVFEHLNWGTLHPDLRERWVDCLGHSAHVIFESEATKALLEREVPGMRADCVRYGVDLTAIETYQQAHDRDALRAEMQFRPDELVLLSMGVFHERKQQLALVHAFSAFTDAHPEATLVLVGSIASPYSEAVRQQVDDFGLAGRIRLVDVGPDIYPFYRCADILVSASDTESLPRSVLEAMAFGVPILSADVFGVGEVVRDNVHGWLFESASGVALLAGFRRALTSPAEELSAMSASCRSAAAAFDGVGYAMSYAGLIDQSLGGRDEAS